MKTKSNSLKMAISSSHQNSINFINNAIYGIPSLFLPYTIPAQKSIIQNHLISLLQDFPSFNPSINSHTYPNGKIASILNVAAEFYVSPHAPPFILTIWVHEFYPQFAPFVYLYPNSLYPIFRNGSVLDYLGAPTCSYLQNWKFDESNSNLLDLMHSLLDLFFRDHPYKYAGFSSINYPPRLKMERMDLVSRDLCKDIMDVKSRADEEMKGLSARRAELAKTKGKIIKLEIKREKLKDRVKGLNDESDKILRWLKIVGSVTDNESVYSEFEDVDEELRNLMDLMAADFAIEDLICALDKLVRQGGVSFEVYIKEVRVLAREQYLHRAGIVKIVESWTRQKLGLDYFGMIMYGLCEKYFR